MTVSPIPVPPDETSMPARSGAGVWAGGARR